MRRPGRARVGRGTSPSSRFPRPLLWVLGGVGALVTLVAAAVVALALFDWNHARGWIGEKVKERTGREVRIAGNLRVEPFHWSPRVHVENVTVSNAAWGDPQPFIVADRLDFSFHLMSLLRGRVVFPEVTFGDAKVLLQRDREGRRNWFLRPEREQTGESPEIHRLTVDKGRLTVKDAMSSTDVTLDLQSTADAIYGLRVAAHGRVSGTSMKASGVSGGLLTLMDEGKAYPLKVEGSVADAKFSVDGSVTGIATLSTVDARLSVSGHNLAKLGDALHISLPATSPYKLSGRLHRQGDFWRFANFAGTVGKSDLGGEFTVDLGKKRPVLGGKLHSKTLDIRDLGGFVGAAPGTAAPMAPGKVLPANPINLEKLRRVDAKVTLTAADFRNAELPLDNLKVNLDLEDGVFRLMPLDFGVAGGTVSSKVSVDARGKTLAMDVDSTFRKLRIGQLVPRAELLSKSLGAIDGRTRLKGQGNSVAAVLGTADGRIDLMSGGGQMSNLLIEYAGADIAEIVKFWMGGDQQVELRCGVLAFDVKNGLATSNVFVIDTDDTYFGGKGSVNLRDETLNLTVTPLPKDFSPITLRGPLHVRGPFANPHFGLDKGVVAARAGAAVLLALINPLAAIIPLIETGPGKDAPCADLVGSLQASIKAPPRKTPRTGKS